MMILTIFQFNLKQTYLKQSISQFLIREKDHLSIDLNSFSIVKQYYECHLDKIVQVGPSSVRLSTSCIFKCLTFMICSAWLLSEKSFAKQIVNYSLNISTFSRSVVDVTPRHVPASLQHPRKYLHELLLSILKVTKLQAWPHFQFWGASAVITLQPIVYWILVTLFMFRCRKL